MQANAISREGFVVNIIRNISKFSSREGGDLGSILLGEKLEASLGITNELQELLSLQMIKLDIQTSSSRTTILQHSLAGSTGILAQNEDCNHSFTYEIRELGVHVISCSIQFNRPAQLNTTLNYFFKFQSLNPLILKTKIHEKISFTSLLLEAQLHNVSNIGLNIQSLVMECVNPDLSIDITNETISKIEAKDNIASHDFNGTLFMDTGSIFQFVFHLKNKQGKPLVIRDNLGIPLGKLEIKWSRIENYINQVQIGRLQTGILYKKEQFSLLSEPLIIYEVFPQEREMINFEFYNNTTNQLIRNIKFYSINEEQIHIDELYPDSNISRSIKRNYKDCSIVKNQKFNIEYSIEERGEGREVFAIRKRSLLEFNFII